MEPREAGGKTTPGVCEWKEKKSLKLKSAVCQHLEGLEGNTDKEWLLGLEAKKQN